MIMQVLLVAQLAWVANPAADADQHPFKGRWYGSVHMNDGQSIGTLIDAEGLQEDWVLRLTQLGEGRNHQPVLESTIEGSSISMSPYIGETIQFWTGELAESGSVYTGTIKEDGRTIGSFKLLRWLPVERMTAARTWIGSVIVPGRDFEQVRLHLARTPSGWRGDVDLPARQCSDHPVDIRVDGTTLLVDIPSLSPIQLRIISPQPLDGVDPPEQVMATWQESGATSTLLMQQQHEGKPVELDRPQTPRGSLPYDQRLDVVVHPIGHELGVTLTMPRGGGDHPAVVLVPGDGGRDRDDRAHGHRFQAVWADSLARRGIASLRFDDRGVGRSGMPKDVAFHALEASDEVMDVRYMAEWLAQQPGVSDSDVGIIGWDKGGLVAMEVAAAMSREVSFLVLLSTPGLPAGDLARASLQRQLAEVPVDPERALSLRIAHGTVLDVSRDPESTPVEIREVVTRYLAARGRLAKGVDQAVPEALIDEETRLYASPAFRKSLRFDPRMILPRLRCPVLAVGGSGDVEDPVNLCLPHIEAAMQRTGGDVTVVEITDVNHRLQPIDPVRPRDPSRIKATVDPRVLRVVTDWILEVAEPPRPAGTVEQP